MSGDAEFSGRVVDAWLASARDGLSTTEGVLLASVGEGGAGTTDFQAFIDTWRSRGLAGSPCTSVWTTGAIAYRCRTCQTNDSSAICVSCFKAGGHEEHDYVLYRSEAGGCCDCGDVASWEPSGCCPLHMPTLTSALPGALLPPGQRDTVQALLGLVFERLTLALELLAVAGPYVRDEQGASPSGAESTPPDAAFLRMVAQEQAVADSCIAWLRHVCSATALRAPAGAALLVGATSTLPDTSPGAQLRELLRRDRSAPGGTAAQQSLRDGWLLSLQSADIRSAMQADLAQRHTWPLVDRLLYAPMMHALHARLLEHLTTLILLLLYDRPFKEQFTYALLRHYRALAYSLAPQQGTPSGDSFSVMHCLDRITVQLFNAPDTTLKLSVHNRLLDILLGLLYQDLSPWAIDGAELYNADAPIWPPDAGPAQEHAQSPMVDLARSVIDSRIFTRVVGDLRMVFAHPAVALHMLSHRRDLVHVFLRVLGALQGANGISRKWGDHVEEENHTWMNAVTLEQSLVSLWALLVEAAAEAQPLQRTSSTSDVASAVAASQALQPRTMALVYAAAAALRAAADWSHADAQACPGFNLDVHPVSLHLPLHRVAAATVSTLVCCLPPGADGVLGVTALIRGSDWLEAVQGGQSIVPAAVGGMAALIRHPARVLAWAAAVRARLWVRNGIEVAHLEAVYSSAFWAETGYDLDLATMQLAMSVAGSSDEADAVTTELLLHTGAPELLAAVDRADEHRLAISEADSGLLARVRDGLFDAAVLARDRTFVSALPHALRVRSGIVHILALRDCTHTQLTAALPSSAAESDELDEVLDEVADFAEPRGAEAGHYSLKPTAWAEWDPHCARYSRADVEQATARALELAVPTWRFATTLRPPSSRPLPPFGNLCRFTRSQHMLRVVRAVLRYGMCKQGALSDDLVVEALQLVALAAADATTAGGASTTSQDVQALAGALLVPGPGESQSVLDLIILASTADGETSITSGAVSEMAAALLADLRARGLAPPVSEGAAAAAAAKPPLADAAAAAREERRRAMRERQRAVMDAIEAQQRAFAAKTGASEDDEDDSVRHYDDMDAAGADDGDDDADETGSSSTDMSVEGEAGLSDSEDDEGGECALCRGDAVQGRGPDASTGALAWVSLAQCSNVPTAASRQQQPPGRPGLAPHSGSSLAPVSAAAPTAAAAALSLAHAAGAASGRSLDALPGVHVGVCGHRVHTGCLDRYVSELRGAYASGRHFPGEYVLAVGAGEFLCPVCRRLANGLLPALPPNLRTRAGDDDDDTSDSDDGATVSLPELVDAARTMVRSRDVAPPRGWEQATTIVGGAASGMDSSVALSSSPRSFSSAEKCSGSARVSGRFLRRRSSNAAALLYATAADTATDRFSDRCRSLLSQLHGGHVIPVVDDADPSGTLWAVLAYNVVHWEVASRPPEPLASEPPEPDASPAHTSRPAEKSPHWIAMQALCRLALRATGGPQTAAAASEPSHALAQASVALLPWLLGDASAEEPPSVILGALPRPEVVEVVQSGSVPRRSSAAPHASEAHHLHSGPHGADFLRALITGFRAPNANQAAQEELAIAVEPPAVEQQAPAQEEEEETTPPTLPSVDEDMPMEMPTELPLEPEAEEPARAKVSQLLMAGDVFALFCELVAAAAFSSASTTTASADVALSPPPSAWAPGLARRLARLCACISVAQGAAAAGLAAAGAALNTRPLDALGAVADTICGQPESPSSQALADAVTTRITPALRRCAILAALLNGSTAPTGAITADDVLTSQLGLPPFRQLLDSIADAADDGMPAIELWVTLVAQPAGGAQSVPHTLGGRDALRAWLNASPTAVAAARPVAPRAPSLIRLPVLYQDLFLEWADRPCLTCRTVPHEPALCLVCGRLVCCAGECCVQPGGKHECAAHALTCGAGVGVYLLIKATKLMVLRAGRRCVYPSPYLDAHGEEDVYLRRGRPLYLSTERYTLVQHLWATSAFDYDTHTLHTSRSGSNFY